MSTGALSVRVTQLACEAHHSPPSSARMCGGIPPLPHMPSWHTQEFTAAGGGGGGDNEQRFGKSPPVYPFNGWLMSTRAGQDILERRSLAPGRTRTPDLPARMLLSPNRTGVTVKNVRPWSRFGVKSDRIGICKKHFC
jgi:hypothetical protein